VSGDNAPPTAPDILGLTEAARLLHVSEDCLMHRARVGKAPGAKIGRGWPPECSDVNWPRCARLRLFSYQFDQIRTRA
jgi:hypothetical protein